MGTTRRYPKAPITEAIIDLRVQLNANIGVDDLSPCHKGEEKAYPNRKNLKVGFGHFEVGSRVSAVASEQHLGFVFTSADHKQVCQARLDGFTMSRLAPYQSWEPFRNEARRLWERYRDAVKPIVIERAAVRFINRLDLPGTHVDLKTYLRTSPEIANDLPQTLEGFFMQLQIPQADMGCKLLLSETIVEPAKAGVLSVILDIDLFRTDDLPKDEEGLWRLFEEMRVRKNKIFESCITDPARELFH